MANLVHCSWCKLKIWVFHHYNSFVWYFSNFNTINVKHVDVMKLQKYKDVMHIQLPYDKWNKFSKHENSKLEMWKRDHKL
jgi:hypothetical protein